MNFKLFEPSSGTLARGLARPRGKTEKGGKSVVLTASFDKRMEERAGALSIKKRDENGGEACALSRKRRGENGGETGSGVGGGGRQVQVPGVSIRARFHERLRPLRRATLESPSGIPISSPSRSFHCLIVIFLGCNSLFRNWEDTEHDLQCASVGGASKA